MIHLHLPQWHTESRGLSPGQHQSALPGPALDRRLQCPSICQSRNHVPSPNPQDSISPRPTKLGKIEKSVSSRKLEVCCARFTCALSSSTCALNPELRFDELCVVILGMMGALANPTEGRVLEGGGAAVNRIGKV